MPKITTFEVFLLLFAAVGIMTVSGGAVLAARWLIKAVETCQP